MAWVVLEEVALDAVVEDGRMVARTSARQLAERLGMHPSTAGNALAALRRQGLLMLEREHGPAGRFGLSIYVLGAVAGLTVVAPPDIGPCLTSPCMEIPAADDAGPMDLDSAWPRSERPCAENPRMAQRQAEMSGPALAGTARPTRTKTPVPMSSTPAEALPCAGQRALDLELGSS